MYVVYVTKYFLKQFYGKCYYIEKKIYAAG